MLPLILLTIATLGALITLAAGLIFRTPHDPDHGTRPQDSDTPNT